MIAFLGYVSMVALLLVVAAAASETLLRAMHGATRALWLAAMLGTTILALLTVRPARPAAVAPIIIAASPGMTGTPGRTEVSRPAADRGALPERPAPRSAGFVGASARTSSRTTLLAAACWILASLGCLVRLLVSARRVARLRRSCRAGRLLGEPVLVSRDTGPAVLGAIRHRIVIPAWVEELDDAAQRLILAHEREHVRARDPLLLHAASVIVALMPWNIPLWFALRRLREAMEIDCDARVLRCQKGAAQRYCQLLLDVGERTVAVATPVLALAERATLLERRIESVTTTTRLSDWRTLVPAATAMLLLTGACRAPRPEIGPLDRFGIMARTRSAFAAGRSDATAAPAVSPRVTAPRAVPAAALPPSAPGVARAPAVPAISRIADVAAVSPALSVTDTVPVTPVRNEAALQRSAAEHQARMDAIADSVILTDYPELTRRPAGTPAFLALVLDDRDKLMRHAVSLDPNLPNDLAAIMLALRVDTISSRTLGLGFFENRRWNVTVGYAAEAMGPASGHTGLRASRTSPLPYALRRVPYERIVDSVARARTPEAYREHEGLFAIAMVLEEDGRVARFAAQADPDTSIRSRLPGELMKRMLDDTTLAVRIQGVAARLRPSHTVIMWGVRR